jgi:hypothetical protein
MSVVAKRLSDYLSGKRTYDVDDFSAAAKEITALSGGLLSAHFTASIAAEGTNPSPLIASDRTKYFAYLRSTRSPRNACCP